MMQSIFRLPWCSDPVAPKLADPITLEKMRPSPVVEIPVLSKLKRKRTDSLGDVTASRGQQDKKPRPGDVATAVQPSANPGLPLKPQPQQTFTAAVANTSALNAGGGDPISPHSGQDVLSSTFTSDDKSATIPQPSQAMTEGKKETMLDAQIPLPAEATTRLQDVIENEFNLQILMKHNELRLIEQELAKCRVALEQLRRVELRPYPGQEQPSDAISRGTGPSVAPPQGYTQASHAAPYGATDGPYASHYSQWLLHDPLFDSTPTTSLFYPDSMAHVAGRSTRNSGSIRKSFSKHFTFPSRPNDALQSIPNYPSPAVKDKSAPLILKRSTDNQFVKLVCNNCQRGNFSSIQGFLNHCRIAHKVDYKSHDAAAIDCGRPLDEHEAANIPSEPVQSTPSHKPSLSRISTAAPTPYRNLVHPLNTAAGAASPIGSVPKRASAPRAPVPGLAAGATPSKDSSFVASAQAPRLSAHFAKYNLGGDLAAAVAGAKQALDLGYDDMPSPDTPDKTSPLDANPLSAGKNIAGGRAGMTVPGARPSSRKGIRQNSRQPRPSPLTPAGFPQQQAKEGEILLESPPYPSSAATFSPHTADSNPGLVSDHEEDDDHGSASEEETSTHHHAAMPRPPFPVAPRTCADNVEIEEVAEDDERVGGGAGLIIRRNGLYTDEEMRGAGSPSRKLGLSKRGA